jgi:hypothetical protein
MKLRRDLEQRARLWRLHRCLRLPVAAAALSFLAVPVVGVAQESEVTVGLPPVFNGLEGSWEGTGVLLQRPAEFHMEWRVASGGFVRLSFTNAWVDERGNRTPVLRSEATYLVRGRAVQGVWIDSRPQRIRLDAVVTDSSLVTTWTAEVERGRTEYIVRSSSELMVRDLVEINGEFQGFGEARYTRRDPAR